MSIDIEHQRAYVSLEQSKGSASFTYRLVMTMSAISAAAWTDLTENPSASARAFEGLPPCKPTMMFAPLSLKV